MPFEVFRKKMQNEEKRCLRENAIFCLSNVAARVANEQKISLYTSVYDC